MTAHPSNAYYDIYVTGTTNMTSSMHANTFASKGHFYDIADSVKDQSVPKIVDKNGDIIEPNKQADDTYLGIEKLSGVNVIAKERI